jgi:hypothetical protein
MELNLGGKRERSDALNICREYLQCKIESSGVLRERQRERERERDSETERERETDRERERERQRRRENRYEL